jgi:hypothetical protein
MKNMAQKQTNIHNLHWVGGALLILPLLVLIVHGAAPAAAQSDGGYDLSWWTVGGGGGSGHDLGGAIGQADAAVWQGGGGYILVGGFWAGSIAVGGGHHIYLPLVVRSDSTR